MNLLNNRSHSLRLLAIALSLFTFLNVSTIFAQSTGTWCYIDYTSDDIFTVPGGCTKVTIEAIGGGGGGGKAGCPGSFVGNSKYSVGSGGGGGAYAYLKDHAVTPGTELTVVVGTGGRSDYPGTASYVQIGSTTLLTAGGGQKGNYSVNNAQTGGEGGTYDGISGVIGQQGSKGGNSTHREGLIYANQNVSGAGGDCGRLTGNTNPNGGELICHEFSGAGGPIIDGDGGWNPGKDGFPYGGGGSGGRTHRETWPGDCEEKLGGNGANGYVRIWYYMDPTITALATPNVICEGTQISLTGETNLDNPIYKWSSTTGGGLSSTNTASVSATPNSNQTNETYSVTYTFKFEKLLDNCKVEKSKEVQVTVLDPAVTLSTISNKSICAGSSVTLTAEPSSTPTGTLSYVWTPTTELTPSNGIGQEVSAAPLSTTEYKVVATATVTASTLTCTKKDSTKVTVTVETPSVVLNDITFNHNPVCDGASEVSMSVSATGNGNITYEWDGPGFSSPVSGQYQTLNTISTSHAGTYTVTATASTGNCTATATTSAALTVNPVPTIAADVQTQTITYGQSMTTVTLTSTNAASVTVSNKPDWMTYDATNHTLTGTPTAAGTYTVLMTATSAEGCDPATTTATVNVGKATATVSADAKSKVYGADEPALTATVTGLQNGDAASVISYIISRVEGEDVGTYTITPSGDDVQGNYNVVYETGTLTITRATVTVTADDKTKIYNNSDPVLTATVSGLQNKDPLSVISYTLSRTTGENVGTYTITPTGNAVQGNYNVNYATGTLTITPLVVTVNITGNTSTQARTGETLSVSGFTAVADNSLYNVASVSCTTATASGVDVGTYQMGLAANQFTNGDDNFDVTFNIVSDGWLEIVPAGSVIVTIEGHNSVLDYDANEHSVSGYDVDIWVPDGSPAYTTADFTFSGTAAATRTLVGTTNMGLAASQFTNTNPDFQDVVFNVTDGYMTINKANVEVIVTGHTAIKEYDNVARTVSGYEKFTNSPLYDMTNVGFTGTATATRTDVGITNMGLAANQFTNSDNNFNVAFNVNDGWLEIVAAGVVIVNITGNSDTYTYNGSNQTVTGYAIESIEGHHTETHQAYSEYYPRNAIHYVGTTADTTATRAAVGTTFTNLTEEMFENTNAEFIVRFHVTNGYVKVIPAPVTVTIVGNNHSDEYNGVAHTVTGYNVTSIKVNDVESTLYTASNFTFSGVASASRTAVGTTNMNLASNQFTNTNSNFNPVTFAVTDGYQTITPTTMAITITGTTLETSYDAQPHTVTGYTATSTSSLFNPAKVVRTGGTPTLTETNAGTYNMGLAESQFSYDDPNFENVTFSVTSDGWLKINKSNLTVTITGHNDTKTYNGSEQSVTGYDISIPSGATLTESQISGPATAEAKGTNVKTENDGKYMMGLAQNQFSTTSTNYNVSFNISDGWLKISPKEVTVKANDTTRTNRLAETDPVFRITVTGLQNNESPSIIGYSVNRSPGGTTPGTYTINVSGPTAIDNYTISYESGVMTITDATELLLNFAHVYQDQSDLKWWRLKKEDHGILPSYPLSEYIKDAVGSEDNPVPDPYIVEDYVFDDTITFKGKKYAYWDVAVRGQFRPDTNDFNNYYTVSFLNLVAVKGKIGGSQGWLIDPEYQYTESDLPSLDGFHRNFTLRLRDGRRAEQDLYNMLAIGDETNPWYRLKKTTILNVRPLNDYKENTIIRTKDGTPCSPAAYDFSGYVIPRGGIDYIYAEDGDSTEPYFTIEFINVQVKHHIGGDLGFLDEDDTYDDPENTHGFHRNYKATLHSILNIKITGNQDEFDYDATSKTVKGYVATSSCSLFDINKLTFTGDSILTKTDAGTYKMNLASSQFSYNDADHIFEEIIFDIVKDGKMVINRAPLTVKADSITKNYGATDPTLTVTMTGFKGSDSESLISYEISRVAGEELGEYAINVTGDAVQGNYDVTFKPGVFTIKGMPQPLSIASASETAAYDGTLHKKEVYTVTFNNVVLTPDEGSNGKIFTMPITGDKLTITPTFAGVTNVADANNVDNNNTFTYVLENNDIYLGTRDTTYGSVKVTPNGNVTVTITGHTKGFDCDGNNHTVQGYDVTIADTLSIYAKSDFSFSPIADSIVTASTVGTYTMNLQGKFTNNNTNYNPVAFNVTDGSLVIVDTLKPTYTGTMKNITQEGCTTSDLPAAASTIDALETVTGLTFSDNCTDHGDLTVSSSDGFLSGGCAQSMIRTYMVTDDYGKSVSVEQTITLTVPDDITISGSNSSTVDCPADAVAPHTVTGRMPTVMDACGKDISSNYTLKTDATPIACNGTMSYTYTFTDCADHTKDWTYTYTISAPQFELPSEGSQEVHCAFEAVKPGAPAWKDNCDRDLEVVYKDSVASIGADGNGTVTHTYTYKDCSGETYDWLFIYTVKAPSFTAIPDKESNIHCVSEGIEPTTPDTTVCRQPIVFTLTGSTNNVSAEGCGDITYTYTYTVYTTNYTWKYTYHVSPDDFTIPTVETSKIVDCASAAVAPITPTVTSCGITITPVLRNGYPTSLADGECEGDIVYIYDYTDCAGHTHPWTYTYTVNKPAEPVLASGKSWPEDQLNINGCYNALPSFPSDNDIKELFTAFCDKQITVSSEEVTSETKTDDCDWKMTRKYTITDGCNTFNKTITYSGSDQTAPAFKTTATWPEDIENLNSCFADADTTGLLDADEVAALYEDCSNSITVSVADVADPTGNCGWTWTRTYTIKDECGNTVTPAPKMKVSGSDQTAPVVTAPNDTTLYRDSNCEADTTPASTGIATAYDKCDANPTISYINVDITPEDACEGTLIIKRRWTAVDACDNQADTVDQIITVKDTIRPTFTKPIDTTVYRDSDCNFDASPEITGMITDVWDNCSTKLDTNYTDEDVTERYNTCEGHMVIERTWTVTDNCGNISLPQAQIIVVRDSIRPTFTAPKDTTIYKDENCEYDITVENVGDVLDEADNCTTVLEATYRDSIITPEDACEGLLVIQRTWSLMDDCENKAEDQIQIITIEDTLAPTFTVPEDITLCRDENGDIVVTTDLTGEVTDAADNCTAEPTVEWNDIKTEGTDAEDIVITREWTVTDDCGNMTSAEQHIIVRPSILTDGNFDMACKDTTIVLPYNTDRKKLSLPAPDTANHMTGMEVVLTNDYPADSMFTVGTTTITWIATDECGHSISCSFDVNVELPPCDSTVIDGYTYPAVRVGLQCWLGENLRNTVYADGSEVANWKDYNNDATNADIYGKLYSWYSAVKLAEGDDSSEPELSTVPQPRNSNGKAAPTDATPGSQFVQGLCPEGWAVPTSGDFMQLFATAGTIDQIKDSNTGWLPGYEGTEPNSGFNSRGAGYYDNAVDRFMNLLGETYYWTSDPASNSNKGTCVGINYHCADGLFQEQNKDRGQSVRCIRVY